MDEQGGADLSPRMVLLVADARAQWAELDRRIAAFDAEFIRWTKENEDGRRLVTIPGVGPTIASALIAAVGKAETFGTWSGSRRLAGSGSAPVRHRRKTEASRDHQTRQQISAQVADPRRTSRAAPCRRARHSARQMGQGLLGRAHPNVAVVALANKMARIAWAMLRHREKFAVKGSTVAA